MRTGALWPIALMLGVLFAQPTLAEDRPQLSLPIACEPHKTCFIQNYVDLDPGPGVRDYSCGRATYDKHSGVDFRILSAEAAKSQVPVLAAADGTVKNTRDGVEDIFFKKAKPEEVAGRECGNGVIIDHGGGWETQYCHLKRGSVRVAKDGKTLFVANGKGETSRPNPEGPRPGRKSVPGIHQYIGELLNGTISVIPLPAGDKLEPARDDALGTR